MKEQETYEAAHQELVAIIKEMETEQIDVDTLSEKVKRAEKLISICKEKLKVTENEVAEILKQLDKNSD